MPYPRKQAVAIFLDKKRREGLAAAKAFGRQHKSSYKTRSKRRG